MSRVECINDSGRNETIPESKWIKKGQQYTVINSFKDMHGVILVQLDEIDLTPYPPYAGFAESRFKVLEDGGGVELVEELELQLVG